MLEDQTIRVASVLGPMGEILTLDTIPPPTTTRWVSRRKAQVVAAIDGGLLTIEDGCERYRLSLEELASWQRSLDRAGVPGLRVTRVQHYRDKFDP